MFLVIYLALWGLAILSIFPFWVYLFGGIGTIWIGIKLGIQYRDLETLFYVPLIGAALVWWGVYCAQHNL